MKETLLKLKEQNPNCGYKKLAKAAGCSVSLAKFHLREGAQEKHRLKMACLRRKNPIAWKLSLFCKDARVSVKTIPIKELTERLTANPVCYLTGRKIDLSDRSSYSFDHIIPICQGGKSTVENLGLTCAEANISKNGFTPDQFYALCKEILENQGYKVEKLAVATGVAPALRLP